MPKLAIKATVISACLAMLSSSAIAWRTDRDVDKMTDKLTFTVFQDSKNITWSTKRTQLDVKVDCSDHSYEVLLSDPWLVDEGPATVRFDKDEAKRYYAQPSTNHKALFVGDSSAKKEGEPSEQENIVDGLKNHKKVVLEYKQSGGSLIDAEFTLAGFKGAIESAVKKCPKVAKKVEEEKVEKFNPAKMETMAEIERLKRKIEADHVADPKAEKGE
jgi:hypothetical protein